MELITGSSHSSRIREFLQELLTEDLRHNDGVFLGLVSDNPRGRYLGLDFNPDPGATAPGKKPGKKLTENEMT